MRGLPARHESMKTQMEQEGEKAGRSEFEF
jgi:hypothetical protein